MFLTKITNTGAATTFDGSSIAANSCVYTAKATNVVSMSGGGARTGGNGSLFTLSAAPSGSTTLQIEARGSAAIAFNDIALSASAEASNQRLTSITTGAGASLTSGSAWSEAQTLRIRVGQGGAFGTQIRGLTGNTGFVTTFFSGTQWAIYQVTGLLLNGSDTQTWSITHVNSRGVVPATNTNMSWRAANNLNTTDFSSLVTTGGSPDTFVDLPMVSVNLANPASSAVNYTGTAATRAALVTALNTSLGTPSPAAYSVVGNNVTASSALYALRFSALPGVLFYPTFHNNSGAFTFSATFNGGNTTFTALNGGTALTTQQIADINAGFLQVRSAQGTAPLFNPGVPSGATFIISASDINNGTATTSVPSGLTVEVGKLGKNGVFQPYLPS